MTRSKWASKIFKRLGVFRFRRQLDVLAIQPQELVYRTEGYGPRTVSSEPIKRLTDRYRSGRTNVDRPVSLVCTFIASKRRFYSSGVNHTNESRRPNEKLHPPQKKPSAEIRAIPPMSSRIKTAFQNGAPPFSGQLIECSNAQYNIKSRERTSCASDVEKYNNNVHTYTHTHTTDTFTGAKGEGV